MRRTTLLLLGVAAVANAQAPQGTTICDYYSASSSASNATEAQIKWITQFTVNVFGGNSSVFSGTTVQGVLSAGTFNNQPIRLTKYFDGTVYSTQGANGLPQAVNWLDGGGTVALSEGRLANSVTSNQYRLFSRFSTLFSRVLGCSAYALGNSTAKLNSTSLYQVHKFMSLDPDELGYFIEQVGMAGRVIGMTETEANTITTRMSTGLTFRCRPPTAATQGGTVAPQSICTDAKCPLAENAQCSAYDLNGGTSPEPALVHGTSPAPSGNATAPAPEPEKKSNVLPIAIGVAVPVGVLALGLIAFLIWRSKRKMKALETRLTQVEGAGSQPPNFGDMQSYGAPSEAGQFRHSQATTSPVYDPRVSAFTQQSGPDIRAWQQQNESFKSYPQTSELPIGASSPQLSAGHPASVGHSPRMEQRQGAPRHELE